jgi:hypothetical protein
VEYRTDPTRIAGGSSRSVLTVALTVAIALGVGIVALSVGGTSERHVADTTAGAPPSDDAPGPLAGVATPSPTVHCHDVPNRRCVRVAAAAVGAILDPTLRPARTVDVWASLLCGSTFDCPPYHLADREPLGSAVVGLAGSTVLWVNVSEIVVAGADRGAPEPQLDAWVIPSGPSR